VVLPWEADIALSSLQPPAADQRVSSLPHLNFGQTRARPPMGFQVPPGEKLEGRAAAVSGANSWSTVYLHAAGIHPTAAAKAAEAEPRCTQMKGGKPGNTPQILQTFQLLMESSKTKCSQIRYSNYSGTSQKLGLTILIAQYGNAIRELQAWN